METKVAQGKKQLLYIFVNIGWGKKETSKFWKCSSDLKNVVLSAWGSIFYSWNAVVGKLLWVEFFLLYNTKGALSRSEFGNWSLKSDFWYGMRFSYSNKKVGNSTGNLQFLLQASSFGSVTVD